MILALKTILAREAASSKRSMLKACKQRISTFGRDLKQPKPHRPKDEILSEVLFSYNEKTPKGCKPLKCLHGITRTSRYKAAAERMYFKK